MNEAPVCQRSFLSSETPSGWDPVEFDAHLAQETPLGIEGLVPGCGKSYSVRDHFKRHNKISSLLTVAPWNRLKCEMSADGYKAITMHKLLGRTVDDSAEGDRKKPYDLTGITHVHFEESRLYTIREFEWMFAFQKQHPTLRYSDASDGGQLQPVGQKTSASGNHSPLSCV